MKLQHLRFAIFFCASLGLLCNAGFAQTSVQTPQFQVQDTWHIGGDGGWDYLTTDPAAHRLYIARGNRVQVVDTDTGKLVDEIGGMQGVHGVALDNHGKFGYISDGAAGMVRAFDRTTLLVTASIPAGQNPDGIVFDPFTQRVFAFNGRSRSATVIDAATNKALQTIPLPGKPEFPQSDNKGTVYANIEDQNEIVRIDAKKMAITATWPIAPCDSPSGLALDRASHRLFSVCDNKLMTVVDTDTGHVVATAAIGDGPDATRYDAQRHLVFSSNGEGTLTVVRQNSANNYQPVQTLPTQRGARTLALDADTGKIYLVTASFGPRPAATPQNPRPRPSILPNSFVVMVVTAK
ncbi:MAG TPA: YncE family protein [Acidobacteriaceae bacterium]|nr:YncE family protein [Acidobacteriaceae bacterium]